MQHFSTAAELHFSETSNSNIMIEAPGVNQDIAAQNLQEPMVGAGKMYLRDVPVVVDVTVTDNWYRYFFLFNVLL